MDFNKVDMSELYEYIFWQEDKISQDDYDRFLQEANLSQGEI